MFFIAKNINNKIEEVFIKAFKELGLKPHGIVFLKPNLCGRPPILPGENSDPVFTKELVTFLLKNGASKVIIGHTSLLGTSDKAFPFEEVIKGGGFDIFYNMDRVEIMNLDLEKKNKERIEGAIFNIPEIVRKADFYINLAKVKTHMETTVSFSLKNQMGLLALQDRIRMHQTDLETHIALLGKILKPHLAILDGIVSMEGNGPHHGQPNKTNFIGFGTDMVELDSAVAYIIGFDFKAIKQIAIAQEIGAGQYPQEENLIKYKEAVNIKKFKPADKVYKYGKNAAAYPTYSCSRCITAVNEFGHAIKKHPLKNWWFIKKALFGRQKINIVFGKADELELDKKDKNIFIGRCSANCAQKHGQKCLDKCPPSVKETEVFIRRYFD